ncbi:MAG: putative PEP-binding protein [Leptolyngbyaceae cyanobacterium bins.349]|nr:putative PEP-binding protein [Leptolyngbyaceae cyanobacterium bins.349]
MINLYWLDQIHANQLASVGFKAFHLSQLMQKGAPVLPGFVISSQTLRTFLEEITWSEPLFADFPNSALRLNIENPLQLQAIAQELRQVVMATPLAPSLQHELVLAAQALHTPTLILRPSLVVEPVNRSVALSRLPGGVFKTSGLLTSRISRTDPIALTQALKHLWSEFLGAKSLFYWQRLNIPLHRVQLAVLVQPIQSAIASGTLRPTQTDLELFATVGLGMAIAQGEVIPDQYQIDVETGAIRSRQLGQKTIAYQLSAAMDRPVSGQSNATQTDGLEDICLVPLNDQQRNEYALSEAVTQQLVQKLWALLVELGPSVELEWVLTTDQTGTVQPFVTQVLPYTLSPGLLKPPRLQDGEPAAKGSTLFPGATLIATGLAVSSGQAIAQATVLSSVSTAWQEIPPHTVLVAPTIPLDWLPLVQQAAGLVSEQGGFTSHSAIVAREVGVPAVTGIAHATDQIQSGELLWVDGDRGRVYRFAQSSPATVPPVHAVNPVRPSGQAASIAPALPHRTKLLVNMSQPEQLPRVSRMEVDGVGLLRAELLALTALNNQHPALWLHHHRQTEWVERMTAAIAEFAEAFNPRPVFYRSLDLRSHEFSHVANSTPPSPAHPMLGIRGTFSYWVDPTLFQLELLTLAAVQQTGYTNVHLILPFVRTVEEFKFCHTLIQQAGLRQQPNFQLWIMAEVPSVLLLLPEYVQAGVQGISIGTNDLTQLLFGIDRDDAQLASRFEERHPAVRRAIAQLIQTAKSLQIPCSICGEAPAQYPELVSELIRWGIDAISVAPEAVEATRREMLQAERSV